jgi:hypothetical protein
MIMPDALTLSCRLCIWMINEYVVYHNQNQSQCSSECVSDSNLRCLSVDSFTLTMETAALRLYQRCRNQKLVGLGDQMDR